MELQIIRNMIYEFRGKQVMLASDLAELYDVETKQLIRQVKRNIDRFEGDDFMFELSNEECNLLKITSRCQNGTLKRGTNIKYAPYAFTELGVAMLSSVLRSNTAIKVNREIMRAFVAMRQFIQNTDSTGIELENIRQKILALEKNDEDALAAINDLSEDIRNELEDIYLALSQLAAKTKRENNIRKIGFKQNT